MTYKNLLAEINNAAIQFTDQIEKPDTKTVPSGKQFYTIDLDSRTIDGPATISVEGEHYAETVYFLVDRFYDSMDLAQTNCVIRYVVNEQSYVYAVPFCDIRSYDGKMIIPWNISMSATQSSGSIEYDIEFYLIDSTIESDDPPYLYSLHTRPAKSTVMTSLTIQDFTREDDTLNLPSRYQELISDMTRMANNVAVFWTDV